MAEKKISGMHELKVGGYVIIEGVACRVSNIQISKPGKHGHSKIRVEAIGLIDEKKKIIVRPGSDNIEVPIIEKRVAQVLSVSGDMANVMDAESFETFDLKIPEELKGTVVDGVKILYWVILEDRVMKQLRGE